MSKTKKKKKKKFPIVKELKFLAVSVDLLMESTLIVEAIMEEY